MNAFFFKNATVGVDPSTAGARVPEEETQLFQAGWSIPAHV